MKVTGRCLRQLILIVVLLDAGPDPKDERGDFEYVFILPYDHRLLLV